MSHVARFEDIKQGKLADVYFVRALGSEFGSGPSVTHDPCPLTL